MTDDGVRILVVDVPRLLWDLLGPVLSRCEGLDFSVPASLGDLREAMEAGEVDVAIVGLGSAGWPRVCDDIMEGRARPHLIGIRWDDGEVWAYTLRTEKVALGPLSPSEIAEHLREAIRRDRPDSHAGPGRRGWFDTPGGHW